MWLFKGKFICQKTLNWSAGAEIPTMDLSKATDSVSFTQISNTFEACTDWARTQRSLPAWQPLKKFPKTVKLTPLP
ncbi:Oligopeptide ABC transporter periplasmic oligopeptide-binding protein OppA [Lactobacillus delbrueckii subsp. bulgaricus]|nr:Hypothetical conserved protein [Lactobacillus delbrueckii subsp. bulgaricus 2038]OAL42319.1 Oligopeptide ABC transporter periplasmic oligopeptide-binding protein OppA [Lactobacillus delbrueckii subsp. bulgaricus]